MLLLIDVNSLRAVANIHEIFRLLAAVNGEFTVVNVSFTKWKGRNEIGKIALLNTLFKTTSDRALADAVGTYLGKAQPTKTNYQRYNNQKRTNELCRR